MSEHTPSKQGLPLETPRYIGKAAEDQLGPPQADESETRSSRKARQYEFKCLASLGWSLFVAGWGDGSTGPLIPRMQSYYHVRTGSQGIDQRILLLSGQLHDRVPHICFELRRRSYDHLSRFLR